MDTTYTDLNSNEGVKEPEAAQPAEDQGVKETDFAEPSVGERDREENARYAAARRKAEAERDKAVLKARQESAEELKKTVEELRQEESRRVFREKMEGEIAQIGKLDPKIKSVEDLTRMPNYEQFRAKVRAGNNFLDAYKLVNMDRLMAQAADLARRQNANNQAGKEHLSATAIHGRGAVSVPKEVAQAYRKLIPGITSEEIQKHYSKFNK